MSSINDGGRERDACWQTADALVEGQPSTNPTCAFVPFVDNLLDQD